MSDTIFERFDACAKSIGIDMSGEELARMSQDNGFTSKPVIHMAQTKTTRKG